MLWVAIRGTWCALGDHRVLDGPGRFKPGRLGGLDQFDGAGRIYITAGPRVPS